MKRSGEWVNNLNGNAQYKSFKPAPLPPNPVLQIDSDMVKKLVEANRELVKLDTASKLIPNVELFISMYVRKEALISSQIEGTQCTLDDVFDPELENTANLDVIDVINYVDACSYALERIKSLPLCGRLDILNKFIYSNWKIRETWNSKKTFMIWLKLFPIIVKRQERFIPIISKRQ